MELRITPDAAGERLDAVLAQPLGSRSRAQRLIDAGQVTVDGATVPKRHRVSSGELVAYCGRPGTRHAQEGEVRRRNGAFERRVETYTEEWTYDLGGNFIYVLTLVNGRVDDVRTVPR